MLAGGSIFTEPIEALGLRTIVTGSVACTIYGEPRLTHDIDLVIEVTAADAALDPADCWDAVEARARSRPGGIFAPRAVRWQRIALAWGQR